MTAELLREAAALMGTRAEAAAVISPDSWRVHESGYTVIDGAGLDVGVMSTEDEADHIASWHPAVALAVAEVLTTAADEIETAEDGGFSWARIDTFHAALTAARAYLGADS